MQESWNDIVTLFSGSNTQAMHEIGLGPFLFLLAMVVVSCFVVAALYDGFFAARATGSGMYRAFPILGLSITGLFVTVQFSLPLSIGLLAALSIIRFRTPIKEPEELGFLMVVVAVAVASATFKLEFLGILLAATTAGLALQRFAAERARPDLAGGMVIVSLAVADYHGQATAVRQVLLRHLSGTRLDRVSNDRDEIQVYYQFDGSSPPDVQALSTDFKSQAIVSGVRVLLSRGGTA